MLVKLLNSHDPRVDNLNVGKKGLYGIKNICEMGVTSITLSSVEAGSTWTLRLISFLFGGV
jgi:hypothetical protein